jgi:hypothetical protein
MTRLLRSSLAALAGGTLLSVAAPTLAYAHAPKLAVFLYNCSTPTQRPATIILTCADANLYVSHITWAGWSGTTAHAKGTLHFNTCTPTCVAGTEKTKPVVFMAMDRRLVKGKWLYTELKARKATWGTGSAYYSLPTSPL